MFDKQTPRRKQQFKTMFPETPTPPQPIPTRWGTWIDAAVYYATYFGQIKDFLDHCDPEEAQSIENAQNVIAKPNIKKDLAFIKANFDCLTVAVTKIQTNDALLEDAINIFDSIRPKLQSISKRPEFLKKFDSVAHKNPGLNTLRDISIILSGEKLDKRNEYIDSLSPAEMEAFKYAPAVSCDVERTFSHYKRVLEDTRRSFVFDNLRKHVIIHCNKFNN